MAAIISSVEKKSIASELGWKAGDQIVSINGVVPADILDYRFHESLEEVVVVLQKEFEQEIFEIEKDPYEPLGVSFTEVLFDGVRMCGAHCVFCFVEQLPPGLRAPLYIKDDDFRLSFMDGNFVTLANVSDEDLERIVTQRLSPLYISVHTTDSELRREMLGRDVPDILKQIDTLSNGQIELHTQIVLCPGINDGKALEKTVLDLYERHPAVKSIAIVPAGISKYRTNETPIPQIDADYSQNIIRLVTRWQRWFRAEKRERIIHAADELFLSAGKLVPAAKFYEGFPQIENGIGHVRKFLDASVRAKKLIENELDSPVKVVFVTGKLFGPVLTKWLKSIDSKYLDWDVLAVENSLFGETVTVSGLLAGKDVVNAVKGVDSPDIVVIPATALRDGVFLDDVTIDDIQEVLGHKTEIILGDSPYIAAGNIVKKASKDD